MKKDIKLLSLAVSFFLGGALFAGQGKECKEGNTTNKEPVATESTCGGAGLTFETPCEGDDCNSNAPEKGK